MEEDLAVSVLLAEMRQRKEQQPKQKVNEAIEKKKFAHYCHICPPHEVNERVGREMRAFTTGDFTQLYELGPVVGRGSTSTVYLTKCRRTGTTWATKVIDESTLNQDEWIRLSNKFAAEIAALRACQHPHIISLNTAIADARGGRLYLIFEYLLGGELFDYVVRKGTLSESEAASVLRDLASAIAHMHSRRVIHRDLKPENLLLDREPPPGASPNVKLIDFGLAKVLPIDRELCASEATGNSQVLDHMANSFLGTRGYLAPEMLKRQHYSEAVDVWAFGVITFVLLCGCLPFDDDLSEINSLVAGRKFGALRYPSWTSNLSPQAKHFLQCLLDIDPDARLTAAKAAKHAWLRPETHIRCHMLRSPALIKDGTHKKKNRKGTTNTAPILLNQATRLNRDAGVSCEGRRNKNQAHTDEDLCPASQPAYDNSKVAAVVLDADTSERRQCGRGKGLDLGFGPSANARMHSL